MKKIAIALSAVAGILFLSGCAYDTGYGYYDRYGFDTGFDRYAYNYDVVSPSHHVYWMNGVRYDCFYTFDARFCG
jgi:hypothetical protein